MLIAIDHGNKAIKTPYESFTSGFSMFDDEPPMASDKIYYDGKWYALSDKRLPYKRDKSVDDDFFILTLFAVAKEIIRQKAYKPDMEITLSVGLPPAHYGALKNRFSDYLKQNGRWISFAYNNQEFKIRVVKVLVYPQAYAAIVNRFAEIKQKDKIFIIDIGGYTTDILQIKRGKLDMSYCYSFESGVNRMINKVKTTIRANYGLLIDDIDVYNVLNGNNTILKSDTKLIVWQTAKDHTKDLFESFVEYDVDLKTNPVIFIGGGSLLLKNFIDGSDMVYKAEYINDIKANAQGYYQMALAEEDKAGV
jgi:plasmid segregation protein ParM